ncbi:MAG TPA: hypothetical protein VG324_08080 [Blastocatellia bacterium]|nr:hypothetical protein [Blastocatellia bacterium]
MAGSFVKEKAAPLFVLAVLAAGAYLPALTQPFISDDYPNIGLALAYGPISGWEAMANDSVQRPRATTFILSYAIYHLFGPRPAAFYSANILLHVLNCWLLFAAGRWRAIGYQASFWAAVFFAVYEGHSEAIMWFSACNELLMFFFGFLSFVFWLVFLEREAARLPWLALSFFFFIPALLSKESSVIFIALFTLPLFFPKLKLRQTPYLLPHILICVPYVIAIFMTRSHSFRFNDRSFVLSAPFWVTWTNSYGRMLWFWGLSATISMFLWGRSGRNELRAETMKINHEGFKNAKVFHDLLRALRSFVVGFRERAYGQIFLPSFIWMGISFIPYMFVDYMHRIPSRQTYLASAGLAWLVGAAVVVMKERCGKNYKWAPPLVLLLILTHNVAYLWTKKRQQFLERAQPTERLLSLARSVDGPIFVKCFPLAQLHAEAALKLILNKPADTLVWDEEEAKSKRLGVGQTLVCP